jgi:dTDP-glucose 4,6-dehydratase
MRLLVTGGAGFIGSNFVHYWLRKNPKGEIVDIDKFTYAADKRNLDGVDGNRHALVVGDIAEPEIINKLVRDIDAVVNFAAETHVDNSIRDSAPFVHSNIVGVRVLLEAVRKYEKRFHQVSTDEVYGSLGLNSRKKFSETSPYNPRNPYAATKAAADHLVRAYCNTYGTDATISNCSNNFGPRQHVEKLIPKTIRSAERSMRVAVYGSGRQVRDWIYVYDHCTAIDLILKKGVPGETYLVSAGNMRCNMDVVREILDLLDRPHRLVKHVRDRPGHDAMYALNSGKIRRELGWKPEFGFENALKDTIQWYLACGR